MVLLTTLCLNVKAVRFFETSGTGYETTPSHSVRSEFSHTGPIFWLKCTDVSEDLAAFSRANAWGGGLH